MVSSVIFYGFLVLATATAFSAVLFCVQAWEHFRYAKSRLSHLGRNFPIGRAMVLVPCKGLDVDLDKNLEALFTQDYENFEIRFLVESTSDPVYSQLTKLIRNHPKTSATILTTGIATTCGQKIHNLRIATQDIRPHIRYLVFMDSDAQPRQEWLRSLLFRIDNEPQPDVGAVTGYRWMVPARATLGNYLVYAINSAVTMLYGKNGTCPIWGGSWAIHRTRFEELGIRDAWEQTISDDLVAAKTLRAHGQRILFEPTAVVASPIDLTFSEAVSFLRRQYTIGRFYIPRAWLFGLLCVTVSTLTWWVAFLEIVRRAVIHGQIAWGLVGFCVALYAMMVLRGVLRQRLIAIYAKQHQKTLRFSRWFDILAGPMTALVNTVCMMLSAIGSKLVWRRVIYTMHRDGTVRHIKRVDELPEVESSKPQPYRRVA